MPGVIGDKWTPISHAEMKRIMQEWCEGGSETTERRREMRKYQVIVEAVIRKTIEVEAVDEYEAQQQAHERFSLEPEEGVDEYYDQQAIEVNEMEGETQ